MKCRLLLTAWLMVTALWLSPASAQETEQKNAQDADVSPVPAVVVTAAVQESASTETAAAEEPAITTSAAETANAKKDSSKKYSSFVSSSNQAPKPGSGLVSADPVTVIAGLLLVVGLIFAVAWLMKRVGAVPMMPGQSMKILAALSVGAREKVILIEVGEQQVLLGVAPGRVSHLQTFEQAVVSAPSQSSDFSATIRKFLQPTMSADKPPANTDKKTTQQEGKL